MIMHRGMCRCHGRLVRRETITARGSLWGKVAPGSREDVGLVVVSNASARLPNGGGTRCQQRARGYMQAKFKGIRMQGNLQLQLPAGQAKHKTRKRLPRGPVFGWRRYLDVVGNGELNHLCYVIGGLDLESDAKSWEKMQNE